MGTRPIFDIDQFRQEQTLGGIGGDYGVDTTFQGTGPRNPTFNTDYPIQTQNNVFESQGRGKEHPSVSDAYNRLKSIFDSYTPDTRATDRYNNLLDNVPQINQPSWARRLAGAGAAMGNVDEHFRRTGGGQDAADRIKYAPYLQEMAAFKEKAGPFQQAAANENQRNIQERTLLSNLLSAQSASDAQDQRAREAEAKTATANSRLEVDRKAAEAKAENDRQRTAIAQAARDDASFIVDRGHLIAVYKNGTHVNLGNYTDDTAIRVQEMKDATQMAVTKQQGANQMGVQGAISGRVGTKPPTPLTPAQIKTDRANKANAIVGTDPTLAPYIKVVNGEVQITAPTPGFWGDKPDPALVEKVKKATQDIYGGTQAPASGTNIQLPTPQQAPQHAPQQAPQQGSVQTPGGPVNPPLTRDDATRQQLRQGIDYKNSVEGIRDQIDTLTRQAASAPPVLIGQIQRQIAALNKQLNDKYEVKTMSDGSKIRSLDGGRTGDYSYDGGVTWGPKR